MRTALVLLALLTSGAAGCATVRSAVPADVAGCIQASAAALQADLAAVRACAPPPQPVPAAAPPPAQ